MRIWNGWRHDFEMIKLVDPNTRRNQAKSYFLDKDRGEFPQVILDHMIGRQHRIDVVFRFQRPQMIPEPIADALMEKYPNLSMTDEEGEAVNVNDELDTIQFHKKKTLAMRYGVTPAEVIGANQEEINMMIRRCRAVGLEMTDEETYNKFKEEQNIKAITRPLEELLEKGKPEFPELPEEDEPEPDTEEPENTDQPAEAKELEV